jgi:nucleotide-binding universal stress UspA family protein
MQVLAVCVDGTRDEQLIAAAAAWKPLFARVEAWCGYGDVAARELEHLRERHGRPGPPPPKHHSENDPDRAQAQAIAQRAVALLREHGIEAQARIFEGRDPGHALAAASTAQTAVLLAAGHHGGVGPKSIGHVARFVIDHATGPVIVVRF